MNYNDFMAKLQSSVASGVSKLHSSMTTNDMEELLSQLRFMSPEEKKRLVAPFLHKFGVPISLFEKNIDDATREAERILSKKDD
jgi:hypothetical protein